MKGYDLTGQRFGRLTATKMVGKTAGGTLLWECQCDCGNVHVARSGSLRHGDVKSCGCLFKEKLIERNTTHGMRCSRLYQTWLDMKGRCFNPKDKAFCNYGGRNITVCDEWAKDFHAFHEWAMDNGYEPHLTIERINNDGNYEPNNCRWATRIEQQNNKRNNRRITMNGETHTLAEWAKITGIKYSTLYSRAYRNNMQYDRVEQLIAEYRLMEDEEIA